MLFVHGMKKLKNIGGSALVMKNQHEVIMAKLPHEHGAVITSLSIEDAHSMSYIGKFS
jgi:hypothetical protein